MKERPTRFRIERPAEFRFTDVRNAPCFSGRTVNISSGGVLFKTDQSLGIGRKVEMLIRQCDSADGLFQVDLRLLGMVIRSGTGWAVMQVRKHRLLPRDQSDTLPDTGNTLGNTAGLSDPL